MRLEGKTAVVTGGAVRVGRAISLALAEAGARVVVAYHRSEAAAHSLVAKIERDFDTRAIAVRCDVTRADDIRDLFDEAEREFGAVEVLVNNAAIFERHPVEDLSEADLVRAFDVNLKGSYLCALEAGRRLRARNAAGKIIQIADVAAFVAWPSYTPYCISKAGTLMLVKCLAKAFAPNVQVNAIAPGLVLPEEGISAEMMQAALARTVIKRPGSPEDVARAVLFLIESDYITGTTIIVDGGRHLA
ncbi:MAG: short-chain dehydrogenase [Pyrinomonas sp.]|uniref:SDR family NAD(P)-dependent oxidoreductase n=1 Tax=Pyrinomonas sp. TaxID=2080306 RepID=UPI00332E0217